MPETKSLLTALLAVQGEAPTLPKDGKNPHFNSSFTPLDTIVEKIGPILVKHGLVWSAFPCMHEGRPSLEYVLSHAESGESTRGVMPLLLTKEDPQGLGSAVTYARRYSICAVLNLVGDDDDDGNAGSAKAARITAARVSEITAVVSEVLAVFPDATKQAVLVKAFTEVGMEVEKVGPRAVAALTAPQADKVEALLKAAIKAAGEDVHPEPPDIS